MSVFYFVSADCAEMLEEKYNEWFDQVHLPLLMKYPKLRGATRYRWSRASQEFLEHSGVDIVRDWPKYLTVYEFDDQNAAEEFFASSEFKAGGVEARQTWKPGDITVPWRAFYELKWYKKGSLPPDSAP